jgi:hypothetical protein
MAKAKKKFTQGCPAHVERLYKAVAHYLDKCGGRAVVAGGIQIIQWPSDKPGQFTVGVKVMGRKPTFTDGSDAAHGTANGTQS